MNGEQYCPTCGTIATPKRTTKGSFWIELALWLLFLLPGFLYSLWRLTSRYDACPKCGAPGMIPTTSPRARAAIAQQSQ
jgi:hypothetical protein